jgi:HEAT repeat protein
MMVIVALLALVFLGGVAIGAYALLAPRAVVKPEPAQAPLEPWTASTDWTTEAGAEFAGLSESARCDLIFAVADLHDERSEHLLLHALDDPSDAVALAAAHALVRRGQAHSVDEYTKLHPGERSQRLAGTLEMLES